MNYQLELKQIVDFPRCWIYREFIQTLMKDRSIRTNGGSCLFYFLILCSYANYSSSYRNIEHLTYKVVPGEWICSLKELQIHFRQKFQHQVISILDTLVEQNLLTYSLHEKNKIIQYKIKDWPKDNTALSYNYPCKKDIGFFFFPIADVHKLIGLGKCSEISKPLFAKSLKYWKYKAFLVVDAPKQSIYYLLYQPAKIVYIYIHYVLSAPGGKQPISLS